MGLFDWFKSSYPLPEAFMVECQTKGIECDLGGSMSHYWLDPSGYLWCGDYAGTNTLEVYEEGDPKYNSEFKWGNWEWIPTGLRGKWHVHPLTKYITIYPAEWSGEWSQWPRLRLHFKSGKLQDFQEVTEQ